MKDELFEEDPPQYVTFKTEEIENLCPDIRNCVIEPDTGMINSVKMYGVLNPILVILNKDGTTYKCAAGRRRYRSAKITGREIIPARVFPYGWTLSGVITLVENEHRSRNPLAEWTAIEDLIKANYTIEEIVQQTGVGIQRVEVLQTLNNLVKELMDAFKSGAIIPSVAMLAAKQKPKVQKRLVKLFNKNGRLTTKDVHNERKASKAAAVAALPASLFAEEFKDWKRVVNESLMSLRQRIKDDAPPEFLAMLEELAHRTEEIVTATPVEE